MKKKDIGTLLTGMALGAALTGGAVAAGITAEPSWSPIFVDGHQVQMTAYNIAGNNFVKLRDIGQAVGFNVYYQNGVQVDSDAPYTGQAPAQSDALHTPAASSIKVSSYKGNTLKPGERSMLVVSPYGSTCTASSSNPAVADVEQVSGQWVIVAKASGTVVISATNSAGETGSVELTVKGDNSLSAPETGGGIDLSANMDIRQEMIRLINQTRKANGVRELTVNTALMNAAQDCSAQRFTEHHTEYECKTAMAYGYPHGFGDNLTAFSGDEYMENIALTAVNNWINSRYHFQAMIDPACDIIGVGVTIDGGKAYCYMFAGDPNSHHPYE